MATETFSADPRIAALVMTLRQVDEYLSNPDLLPEVRAEWLRNRKGMVKTIREVEKGL